MLANHSIDTRRTKSISLSINKSKSNSRFMQLRLRISRSTTNKTAIVCKMAQISPDIWVTLPLEVKK
jgi:hypothetical protein